eukprot:Skav208344  [mRNA]  locus=scaffold4040:20060:20392:- [translate_table: standard]
MTNLQEEAFHVLHDVNVKAIIVPNALLLRRIDTTSLRGHRASCHHHGFSFLFQRFMRIKLSTSGLDVRRTTWPTSFAKGAILEEVDVNPLPQVSQGTSAAVAWFMFCRFI